MTNATRIATVLGALSLSLGTLACNKADKQATRVPDATDAKSDGECLHSEGCCGGHTAGDGSCGAAQASASAASVAGEAAVASTRFEWTIEPGKFAEINVELEHGATMTASFEGGDALAWNVHSHPGDVPKIHAEGTDAAGAPAFVAEQGGLYSYLWVNKGKTPVKLTIELRIDGRGRVHSTHPAS